MPETESTEPASPVLGHPATAASVVLSIAFAIYTVLTPTNVLLVPTVWGLLLGIAYFLDVYLLSPTPADRAAWRDHRLSFAERGLLVATGFGTLVGLLVLLEVVPDDLGVLLVFPAGLFALAGSVVCWRQRS